uniref:G2/mitotic-specific cyclin-B2 n=1 Tax=Amphiprion percula TaxID=161767 RepID=A0A3P8TJI1_AMPPE
MSSLGLCVVAARRQHLWSFPLPLCVVLGHLASCKCRKYKAEITSSRQSQKAVNCHILRSSCRFLFPRLTIAALFLSVCYSWEASDDVLMLVNKQDQRRSTAFLLKHPSLQIRMRSILLDWLIEVSEAHTLHRQTFYLAQDYLDRFMLKQNNIEKGILQLIGITCLFIASKMEETCPPKVSEMAYVTAGTYYEEEVLQMELIILKLLDLCILNIEALDFEYRVLAASVLCHFIPLERVEKASGLSKDVLQPCLNWMAPFVETVGCTGSMVLKEFTNVKMEDRHNIQTHSDYMAMLVSAFLPVCGGYLTTQSGSKTDSEVISCKRFSVNCTVQINPEMV